jgi:hypothetical protein
MVTPREIELRLIEALEPVALACPEGRFSWKTGLRVSDYDVGLASRCQAAAAATDDGFVPAVFNTFKAIAKGAARAVGPTGGVRPALQAHVTAARRGDNSVDEWIADYLSSCDQAELVETMHRSATWLHRTAAVLGVADFDRFSQGRRLSWDFPDRELRLTGAVDLIEDDTNVPVLVVPSLDDPRLDQAALNAVLYFLSVKAAASTVRVIVHSTGESIERPIEGIADRAIAAVGLAAQAVAARGTGPDGLHRSASFFTCRDCEWADTCEVKQAAEAQRPQVRQGIRLG